MSQSYCSCSRLHEPDGVLLLAFDHIDFSHRRCSKRRSDRFHSAQLLTATADADAAAAAAGDGGVVVVVVQGMLVTPSFHQSNLENILLNPLL